MTPERLNALEHQLTAAMELDSSRDIYFDRHGEDVIRELIAALRARPEGVLIEPFVVKHYGDDQFPTIKGNGFDGLQVGKDREEAEDFIKWINERLAPQPHDPCAEACQAWMEGRGACPDGECIGRLAAAERDSSKETK